MEVLYPRCAGLDVHQQTVVACARVASNSTVHQEVRTFGTASKDLLALADWLTAQGCTHVAMESTGVYWKPIWHVLDGQFELVLANALQIRSVPGRKTDVNDAMWIGDLLAHGLIRGSFVPPAAIHELRDLTRTRKQLVREGAQHTLRIQKVLEDANLKLTSVVSDVMGMSGRAMIEAIIGGEQDPERLADLSRGRLKASRHVGWGAGCGPRQAEGAGKRFATRTRPGNPWLKTTLVQVAWVAARTRNTYLRAQFLRLKSRRGPKKAILAVAASMVTAAYHILKDETTYHELGSDHFERRDKSQITRRLIRRLEELGLSVEVKPAA